MAAYTIPARQPGQKLNYRVAAKADRGEMFLYDLIGERWFGGIGASRVKSDLKAMGAVKTIDVHINSDGGNVFEGRAIQALLAQHGARIVVWIDGIAASIASIIAMAGHEIRMADGAFMMIHEAWGVTEGPSAEHRQRADLLDSINIKMVDTYAARSKQDRAQIATWMAEEKWMPANEAVDLGFADVVDVPLKAAAAVRNPAMFRNLPAALRPNRARALATIDALRG
jgi:ATP-dependent protease ClpP protease subunit